MMTCFSSRVSGLESALPVDSRGIKFISEKALVISPRAANVIIRDFKSMAKKTVVKKSLF